MNQEVPQPTTATRSPGRGNRSADPLAAVAALSQAWGWRVISSPMNDMLVLLGVREGASRRPRVTAVDDWGQEVRAAGPREPGWWRAK